jgi:hypothetical protein
LYHERLYPVILTLGSLQQASIAVHNSPSDTSP